MKQVTQVFIKTSDHLRVLEVEGDNGNIEVIRTTDVHPFYVDGRGWVNAGELQAGDRVQETDGSWQTVLSAVREGYPDGFTVHNIEVGEHHTYFVEDGFGAVDPVWVHNANLCSGRFREDVLDRWSQRLGRRVHPNRQAHHIVPQGDLDADDLRNLLSRNGVDVQDVVNGVPLLENVHLGRVHARRLDYIAAVRERLSPLDGQGAQAIKNELDNIGWELFRGTFRF